MHEYKLVFALQDEYRFNIQSRKIFSVVYMVFDLHNASLVQIIFHDVASSG